MCKENKVYLNPRPLRGPCCGEPLGNDDESSRKRSKAVRHWFVRTMLVILAGGTILTTLMVLDLAAVCIAPRLYGMAAGVGIGLGISGGISLRDHWKSRRSLPTR